MKYQLIIFDWDGTLYDSGSYILSCVQHAAQQVGITTLTPEDIRRHVGLNYETVLKQLLRDYSLEQRHSFTTAYKQTLLLESLHKPSLFLGAREVLERLKKEGYWLAVATGKGRRDFDRDIKRFDLQEMFMASRCGDEGASKPNPEIALAILDELGVSPNQALMIGDTVFDMELATNAGIDALAVTYGLQSKERLMSCQVIDFLADVFQLPKWLSQFD